MFDLFCHRQEDTLLFVVIEGQKVSRVGWNLFPE